MEEENMSVVMLSKQIVIRYGLCGHHSYVNITNFIDTDLQGQDRSGRRLTLEAGDPQTPEEWLAAP